MPEDIKLNQKIRKYSRRIILIDLTLQSLATFDVLLTFFTFYLIKPSPKLVVVGIPILLVSIFGIIMLCKKLNKDPLLVSGVVKDIKYYLTTGKPPHSGQNLVLEINRLCFINTLGKRVPLIPEKTKKVFNCHYRLIEKEKVKKGESYDFVAAGNGVIFATLKEVATLNSEELQVSFKTKRATFLILLIWLAVIIFIILFLFISRFF